MRHPSRSAIAPLVLTLLLGAATAQAEVVAGSENVPPVSEAPMGRVAVRRGVQGPAGLFTARLSLLVNASKGDFGKPTSFAPDLYYAITDNVQIGLLHTGPMGWQSTPGVGLCLTGEDNGCPNVYRNVGFDFMYGLLFGDFHLSLHSSFYLLGLGDPVFPVGPMWTVGVTGKFHFTDMVALFFDPQLGFFVANRDSYEDQLFLPLELQFQLGQMVSLKVLSGLTGQLSELGDTIRVPLGLGVLANVSPNVDVGLRFSFDNLLGHAPPVGSRTDERSLALLVNVRI
jgi:hypothetical protein